MTLMRGPSRRRQTRRGDQGGAMRLFRLCVHHEGEVLGLYVGGGDIAPRVGHGRYLQTAAMGQPLPARHDRTDGRAARELPFRGTGAVPAFMG
jgi:hypothetical protein